MKKVKVIAVITAALMLLGVYCSSAFALGDAFSVLGEYFGLSGNTGNSNTGNPDDNDEPSSGNSQVNADSGIVSILQGILGSAANALTSSQITDILNNFDVNDLLGGDSDVINEVLDLIGANTPTKSDSDEDDGNSGNSGNSGRSQTPATTAPQYTNVYVTEAPAVTYSYNGPTSAVTTTVFGETTTGTGETTTLAYLAPSTVYAEQISTTLYDYSVETTEAQTKDGVSVKMVIGIAILMISGIAVVGVALSLKKSRV